MRKVFFRADASQGIGYGHFVRSLALADMLREDFDCCMFTAAPDAFQVREAAGICRLEALDAGERRFDDFLNLLWGDEIVVLDNYFYTTDYQRQIKSRGCALVCIDDMHDKRYVCDAVVNHGFVSADEFDAAPGVRLCLGPEYSLLRRPFLRGSTAENAPMVMSGLPSLDAGTATAMPGNRPGASAGLMNIAICFGGSDQLGLAEQCRMLLVGDSRVGKVTVVGGNGIRLDAEGMASLFRSSDLAVVSMSTVCLEALACGTKVAAGWYVDNQKQGYEEFVRRGLICPLGYLGDGVKSLEGLFGYQGQTCPRLDYSSIPGRFVELFKSL